MEACSQLLRRWQTYSDLPEFTELVTARVSSAGNMPCYGFCYGFAMTSGLYGCQVWATSSLTYDSSNITPAHVLHLGFLKRLLSVKKGTDTYCVLSKTGQMPIFFYWFRCIIRFWNSLLSSINPLLEKVVQADLLIANRSDTWTYQVLHARTPRIPCISAIFGCHTISRVYPSKTVRAHFARTYHRELERA